jgi:hypothetical protein
VYVVYIRERGAGGRGGHRFRSVITDVIHTSRANGHPIHTSRAN